MFGCGSTPLSTDFVSSTGPGVHSYVDRCACAVLPAHAGVIRVLEGVLEGEVGMHTAMEAAVSMDSGMLARVVERARLLRALEEGCAQAADSAPRNNAADPMRPQESLLTASHAIPVIMASAVVPEGAIVTAELAPDAPTPVEAASDAPASSEPTERNLKLIVISEDNELLPNQTGLAQTCARMRDRLMVTNSSALSKRLQHAYVYAHV